MLPTLVSIGAVVFMSLVGFGVIQAIGRLVDKVNVVDARVSELKIDLQDQIDEVCGDVQDHKIRCHVDSNAVITTRLATHDSEISRMRRWSHWIDNCVHVLFQKVPSAHIPPRVD